MQSVSDDDARKSCLKSHVLSWRRKVYSDFRLLRGAISFRRKLHYRDLWRICCTDRCVMEFGL